MCFKPIYLIKSLCFVLSILCGGTVVSFNLRADTLYLTSLHWPPYSSQEFKHQGACVAVARAALKAMGHELVVDFYPWSRAKKLAKMSSSKYLGYFPEYSYQTQEFIFTDSMGSSPLGLVERKSHPIRWHKVADLNQYYLGVVEGYVNTSQLDQMIASGDQPVEVASSDIHNIQKVASARVQAAAIDTHVLRYLIAGKQFNSTRSKLQINQRLLGEKQLYIGFRNTAEGRRWRDIFDAGLAKIDTVAIMSQHLPNSNVDRQ